MKTPETETNGNGMILGEMMTHDDLLRELNEDREEMIDVLIVCRINDVWKKSEEGLLEMVIQMDRINGYYNDSDHYLVDDDTLEKMAYGQLLDFYSHMTNEEIVEWYRENEPYVFGTQTELERIFAL